MQWTKERVAEARNATLDLQAMRDATERKHGERTVILRDLIAIGIKCVDPSAEDVERVAGALILSIGSPWEWGAMPDEVKALWRTHARAAFTAIAEGE